jgi:hypothetical protein
MTFVALDGSGNEIDGATLPIQNASGHVSGTINWYANPTTSLAGHFTIQIFVTDTAGGSSNTLTLSFNVVGLGVTSTTPEDEATGVPSNIVISAVFNEDMDPSTIDASTFQLWTAPTSGAPAQVAGIVTYANRTAIFTPTTVLPMDTTCTVTITIGVRNLLGNALSNDYTWSFTVAGLFLSSGKVEIGSAPQAVAIGDVTGDGRKDLVVATSSFPRPVSPGSPATPNPNDFSLFLFQQNHGGTFTSPTIIPFGSNECAPSSIDLGDLNHDGRNDVVVGHSGCGTDTVDVFLQDPSGSLGPRTTYSVTSAFKTRIGDFNNDGRADLVTPGGIMYQGPAGDFSAPAGLNLTEQLVVDLDVGDVNHDGLTDVVVLHMQGIDVVTQKADGSMNTAVYYSIPGGHYTNALAVGDINGDGRQDVVATIGANKPDAKIAVFPQNASGSLDAPAMYTVLDCPWPVKIGDLNSDGRQDVILAHPGFSSVGVLLQKTDGTLGDEKLYRAPYYYRRSDAMAVGDLNGDGRNDVAIVDENNAVTILYQNPFQ